MHSPCAPLLSALFMVTCFTAICAENGRKKTSGHHSEKETLVANAGPDVAINSDRYHLNASLSRVPDGMQNCEVSWVKVSGPEGGTITDAKAGITPVTDLDLGTYTYRLTIKDPGGVSSTDDVTITVPVKQTKDEVDEFVNHEMERLNVKGLSLAIIDGGKVVKVKGYGFTDADRKTPVTPMTLFQAASTSKVIAAYGALRMVEEKRLSLDDDVNTKLTSWKVPENQYTKDEKVTLRRLIAHMAGVNIDGFYGYPRGEQIPSLLEVLDGKPPANSAAIRVVAVPGSRTAYSGGGYCIIQQLLADVSGESFADYIKQNIFDKIGMRDSTFECPLPESKWSLAAHGYGYSMPDGKSGKLFAHQEMPWKWNSFPESAAAGLWATAGDLALFIIDVQNTHERRSSTVVSKEMVDQILARVPGCKWPLGLGGMVLDKPGEKDAEFRFSGTNAGFQCGSFGTVNSRQGCVIMYNEQAGEAFPLDIRNVIAKAYGWPK